MLQEIQELDPAGVGARNLQECLLLQVERIKDYSDVTVEIIKNYMEEVAKNHLPNIAKKLQVSLEEVQDACEEIRKLNQSRAALSVTVNSFVISVRMRLW